MSASARPAPPRSRAGARLRARAPHRPPRRGRGLVACALACLAACAGPAGGDGAASASDPVAARTPAPDATTHALVLIHAADPPPALAPDEQEAAMQGHFTNMARLTEEGHLLLAGPLGEPRGEASHRGLFLLDTTDPAEARALAQSDPAFRAGSFRFEVVPARTDDPVGELPALDHGARFARLADDPTQTPETAWRGRGFVILSGRADAAHEEAGAALDAEGLVAFTLRLRRDGGEELWLLLDVQSADAARERLGAALEPWTLHGWYGSDVVADLAGR